MATVRKYAARPLTEEEILNLLENSDVDSDLEGFSSDEDDPLVEPSQSQVLEIESSDDDQIEGDDEGKDNDVSLQEPTRPSKRKLIWKQKEFEEKTHPPPLDFQTLQNVTVRSPLQYHEEYFGNSFFENATEKTNMYAIAKTGKELKTTPEELKTFFGINLLMGCIRYPRLTMYWQKGIELKSISSCMSRDRFLELRKNFHLVDTVNKPQDADVNALWKVQPIIDAVRAVCLGLPRHYGTYSIDEQMVPFSGRCKLKQFVKNKPQPVGLKNFVLTSSSGCVLDFEMYQGQSTPLERKDLGLGPAVVLRLVRSLPQGSFIYFDRYFNTLGLLDALCDLRIEGSGTIMANRLRDIKLTQNKMNRGESHQYVSSDDRIVVTEWRDNQKIVMASTCSGIQPEAKVQRWNKAEKKYIDVNCPSVETRYNKCMGGVDVCDQQMECYRTWFRTKKWTLKVILHFLDLATVNSWMKYREHCLANKYKRKQTIDLLKFRMAVAEARVSTPQRERPGPEDENDRPTPPPAKKQKVYTPSPIPGCDKRYDGYDHWPVIDDISSPRFCRLEGCKSRTKLRSHKCDVYLCLSKDKDCFRSFHVK